MYKLTLVVTTQNRDALQIFKKISKIYDDLKDIDIVQFEIKEE